MPAPFPTTTDPQAAFKRPYDQGEIDETLGQAAGDPAGVLGPLGGKAPPQNVGFDLPGVSDPGAMQGLFQGFEQSGAPIGQQQPGAASSSAFLEGIRRASQALNEYNDFATRNMVARAVPGRAVKGFARLPQEAPRAQGPATEGWAYTALPKDDVYVPMYEGERQQDAIGRYRKDMERWNSPEIQASRRVAYTTRKLLPEFISRPLGLYKRVQDLSDIEPIVGYNAGETFDPNPDWTVAAFIGTARGTSFLLSQGGRRLLTSTKVGQKVLQGLKLGGERAQTDALLSALPKGAQKAPSVISGVVPKTTQVFDWVGYKLGKRAFSKVRPETIRNAEQALDKSGSFLEISPTGKLRIHPGPKVVAGSESAKEVGTAMQALKMEMNTAGANVGMQIVYGGDLAAAAASDVFAGGTTAAAAMTGGALFGTPEEQEAYREAFPEAIGEGMKWGAGFGLFRILAGGLAMRNAGKTPGGPTPGGGRNFQQAYLMASRTTPRSTTPPIPKLLGQGPKPSIAPLSKRPQPGPQTPDTGLYNKPLEPPLTFDTGGRPSTELLRGQVEELNLLKRNLDSPKDLQQLHDTLDSLAADQAQYLQGIQADPTQAGLAELRTTALGARFDTIKKLLGKDLAGASEILGIDANVRVHQPFLNPQALSLEPQVMGIIQWSQGLAIEAASRGVDVAEILKDVPIPEHPEDVGTMGVRTATVMRKLQEADPSASVGPPENVAGGVPPEVQGIRPVTVEPLANSNIRTADELEVHDAPTAQEAAENPASLREQTQLAAKLASGNEEQIGRLVLTKGEPYSTESPEIPIIQDRAGRLFAEILDPDGHGTMLVEVTDDVTRAMIPQERVFQEPDGTYTTDELKWDFMPNTFSSVAYTWDKELERFAIDKELTAKRSYIQEIQRNRLYDGLRVGIDNPFENVVSVLDALTKSPPTTLTGWNFFAEQLQELELEHFTKRPQMHQARSLSPTSSKEDVLKTYADMLSDYQGIATFLEMAKAEVFEGKSRYLQELTKEPVTEERTKPLVITSPEIGFEEQPMQIFRSRATDIDRSITFATALGRKIPPKIEAVARKENPIGYRMLQETTPQSFVPSVDEFLSDSNNSLTDYENLYGPPRLVMLFGRPLMLGETALANLDVPQQSFFTSALKKVENTAARHFLEEDESLANPEFMEAKIETEDGVRYWSEVDPALFDTMGGNLYSGDLGKIVVKELFQNARDALGPLMEGRAAKRAKEGTENPDIEIDVDFRDAANKKITMRDYGIGMSPHTAAKEFVDLGGTYKVGTENSGGFGIAKIAIFANSEHIKIATVWKDPETGEVWQTELEGAGRDLLDKEVGLKGPAPAIVNPDTERGTLVEITLKPDVRAERFHSGPFMTALQDFNRTPLKIKTKLDGQDTTVAAPIGVDPERGTTMMEGYSGAGFTAEVEYSNSEHESTYITAHILNHGIYQFGQAFHLNDDAIVPRFIVVNIKSDADPRAPNYPFRLDREGFRDHAEEAFGNYGLKIRDIAVKKHSDALNKALMTSTIIGSKGVPRKPFDPTAPFESMIVDTDQALPQEFVDEIANHPDIKSFNDLLEKSHNLIADYLAKKGSVYKEQVYGGVSVGRRHVGINIQATKIGLNKHVILYNIFNALKHAESMEIGGQIFGSQVTDQFAANMVSVITHELVHQESWEEGPAFTAIETFAQGLIWRRGGMRLADQLVTLLEENNGQILDTIVGFTAQLTDKWADNPGTNIFGKISSKLARGKNIYRHSKGDLTRSKRSGLRSPDALSEGDTGQAGGMGDSPELLKANAKLARQRTEALHRAALGQSFSKHPKLFRSLKPEERFDYLVHRIATGNVATEKHLSYLDPSRWKENKRGPKYFGGWMPSDAQLGVLKDAHNERVAQWNRSKVTVGKLKANRQVRTDARKKGKYTATPNRMTLEEVLKVDPGQIEEISKDPYLMDEWVRGFNLSQDPVTKEIADLPEVKAREDAISKLELLKDTVRAMDGERLMQGTHPSELPREPWGGIKRTAMNSMGRINTIRGRLRMMGRPMGVIGTRKQIMHPKEYKAALERGDLERNVHHMLWTADLKRHQEIVNAFNEFEDLQIATHYSPELDRAIFMHRQDETPPEALAKLPPNERFFKVKRGLKTITIDLAQWLPKLSNFYQDIITRAEPALRYKFNMERTQYKFDGQQIEAEMQRRIEDFAGKNYAALGVDEIREIQSTLRDSDKGAENSPPFSTEGRSFRMLEKHLDVTLKKYNELNKKIEKVNRKGYRREGYITYIMDMVHDEMVQELSDPYSTYSRFTSPEIKNRFLEQRKGGEPLRSWLTGWFMYVPMMAKTIHLEPALLATEPKIKQLPSDLQQYTEEWVRALKGKEALTDRMFNRMAFESWVEEPSALNTALSTMTSGKIDALEKLRSKPRDLEWRGPDKQTQVSTRLYSDLMQGFVGWGYITLLGPLKIAKMTITEAGFILREAMKSPIDLPYSVLWSISAASQASYDTLREFASWARSYGWQGPRYYSEPTMMGVTDSIHEMAETKHADDAMTRDFSKLSMKATKGWYSVLRAAEFWLRGSTYYWLKDQSLHYGLSEEDAMIYAAKMTNDLIGQYGVRETSPFARSKDWRTFWMFLRFPWAKSELLLNDLKGTMSLGAEPFIRLLGGPTTASQAPNPLQGDQGMQDPQPPKPPDVSKSRFGEWEDSEQESWEELSAPVAKFGGAFPQDRTAKMRSSLALLGTLLAVAPGIGLVYQIAKMVFDEDEEGPDRLMSMIWPYDLSRFGEIAAFYMMEDVSRVIQLTVKKNVPAVGLSSKEEKELERRRKNLSYLLAGPLARYLKKKDREEREANKIKKPPQPPSPPKPPGP